MVQVPLEAKQLIDEIVQEIRNVRIHRDDLVSFDRVMDFRNRLVRFQNEAAPLSASCGKSIQIFLNALETEINRLLERLHNLPHPAEPEQQAPDSNVIQLYPPAAEAVSDVLPEPAETIVEPPAAEEPPKKIIDVKERCVGALDLLIDYLRLLAAEAKPVEASTLLPLKQEIELVRSLLLDSKKSIS